MTTAAQLRKSALGQEGTTADGAAYAVDKAVYASFDDGSLHLRLPADEAADMAAQHEGAEVTGDGVTVPIANVGGQGLNYWVRQAWLHAAPREVAERVRWAATVEAGEVGDLPRSIGRPATRALAAAGVTSLVQVAALPVGELDGLHGVGPKAVRLLREAIAN